jgi:hypothetical protein
MENEGLSAAVERLNSGAPIPAVEPSQIEHAWELVSRIPVERRKNASGGLNAVCGNLDYAPNGPDEQIALMTRYALLDALLERGILNDDMKAEPERKHVFAAAATIPCDKRDLAEALAERMLRDASPEEVERTKEDAKNEGWGIDRPKIGEKFIDWIRTHR